MENARLTKVTMRSFISYWLRLKDLLNRPYGEGRPHAVAFNSLANMTCRSMDFYALANVLAKHSVKLLVLDENGVFVPILNIPMRVLQAK